MSWASWRRNMHISITGKITLRNIDYDVRFHRVPKNIIEVVKKKIAERWNKADPNELPEDVMQEIIVNNHSDLVCRGSQIPGGPHRCVRVMNAQDFAHYHIERGRTHISPGHLTDRDMQHLKVFGVQRVIKSGTKMSGRRRFSWVTEPSSLENEMSRVSLRNCASHVRNLLGLLHFAENYYLVGVVFPEKRAITTLMAPTFIEGSPSLIYRSKQMPDGWGRAVNLVDFSDGLKEAVHPEVEFTPEFEIIWIGRIQAPLPPSATDYLAFLKTLPTK